MQTGENPYPLDGPKEERRAIVWMKGRLSGVKAKTQGQADDIQDLLDDLDSRLVKVKEGAPLNPPDWYEDIWDRFLYCMTGVSPDDAPDQWEPPYEWRQWRLESPQTVEVGYSDSHLFAYIPEGGGSSIHYYSKPPSPITWRLESIQQKSVTFFIGKARVSEIDAVCSVPQLPEEVASEEIGKRVLDPNLGSDQWQRRVDPIRVLSIKNFIAVKDNIIANSAIVYAPAGPAVSLDDSRAITIDFEKFLNEETNRWADHSTLGDLRPLWLIDGQHRVRALAQTAEGKDLEIPIIVFPPDFALSGAAKIFSEINTLQLKLAPLHTLFMQHRFGIPSPVPKRDFKRPFSKSDEQTWDSRANNLSYEIAAYLTSHAGGPLYGRIKFLDQDNTRLPIIQAHQWVDFSRSWFAPNQVYEPQCDDPQEVIREEVENFFQAFINTCNHAGWRDGRPRWSSTATGKGLLQRQASSQALVRLYPTAADLARRKTKRSPIPVTQFETVLQPLKWVDWLDDRLLPLFGGGGERGRTMIRIWMETALKNGEVYPLKQVMAVNIRSKPGRGLLSPPGDGTLEAVPDRAWPSKGRPVTLRATQPANTLSGSRWLILDDMDNNHSPDPPTVPAKEGLAKYVLHHASYMDTLKYLDVRVDWFNTVTTTSGKARLRLTRPTGAT
jgi:DGQHR domain-containing protein